MFILSLAVLGVTASAAHPSLTADMLSLLFIVGNLTASLYETVFALLASPLRLDNVFDFLGSCLPQTVSGALLVVLLYSCLLALATISMHNLLRPFDLRLSFKELRDGRPSGRFAVLDQLRFVMLHWIITNHTGSEGRVDVLERSPTAEPFKRAVHNDPLLGALLGNSALGVEGYLFMSGTLAAVSWLREAKRPFSSHYTSYMWNRVLRLWPSVAAFVFLSTGPIMRTLLPRFHDTMVVACGWRGIASHLLFVGNLQEQPTCLGYLWYMGLDMQLHLLAPFLLHWLHRRPRAALSAIAALITASAAARAVYCISYDICNKSDVDIPFIHVAGVDAAATAALYRGLWPMYGRPPTKAGPFLVGVAFGWAASGTAGAFILTTRQATLLFRAGLLLAVATIYAILPEYWWPEMGSVLYNVVYTATFRTVFAIAVAMIAASSVFHQNRPPISPLWALAAKLSFGAYLWHMPIVYLLNFFGPFQTTTSAWSIPPLLFLFVAPVSLVAAFIFYVTVESPTTRLLTPSRRRSHDSTKANGTTTKIL